MTTATEATITPFEGARTIRRMADQGWTADQIGQALGGRPDQNAINQMASTFRAPENADWFRQFWA